MGVVAVVRLVLDVGDRDRDPALALLGRVVDRIEGAVLGLALERQVLRDRRGQRRLAVIDVADRADVHVRLGSLELLLGHGDLSLQCLRRTCRTGAASPVFVSSGDRPRSGVEPTIGLEPMTSSLPRKCSAS